MSKVNHGELIRKALMTGVSYVIPFVVAGGVLMTLSIMIWGVNAVKVEGTAPYIMKQYGASILGLMVPIIAGYISYSLADRPGLAPGMAAGLVAVQTGGGFLGGLVGGLIAGYVMMYIKKIKVNRTFMGVMNFLVYPILGSLIVGIIMLFIISKPIGAINTALTNWLKGLEGINAMILAAIIGAMACFDMGGPVNKAAFTFSLAAIQAGIGEPYAAFTAAKMVPGFALALSAFVFPKFYTEDEQEAAKASWILAAAGITEGAIPLALADPLTVIPSMMVGGAVASAIARWGGASLLTLGGSLFTLPLTKNAWALILGLVVGTIVAALVISFLKGLKYRRKNTFKTADGGN